MERLFLVVRRYMRVQTSSGSFVHLFVSKRLIHGAASALLGIFVPIFLYQMSGENFYIVGIYYAILSLVYALILVTGTQIMNRYGTKVSLVIAGVFSTIYFIFLYYMNVDNFWLLLGPVAVAVTLFRVFHWVPYYVDFAAFTKTGERGRNVSLTYATIAFMGIIGPILAGYIIKNSGYSTLFAISILLLVAATISYAFVPRTYEKFIWKYKETFSKLFSKEYRPLVIGQFAQGLENPIAIIAWPIFLYEILDGNILEIGALATLIMGVTIIIQLMVGGKLDKVEGEKQKFLKVGSTLYAVGWIIKIFVLSTFQIFFAGLYHNITKVFTKTSFDTIVYDMSADQGHYVDEFTVLREIALHLGKALSLIIITILTLFISIKWTFVIGAGAALLFHTIYRATTD